MCYVMEYMEVGTLHSVLSRLKRFNEAMTRFYAAEIILAVNRLTPSDPYKGRTTPLTSKRCILYIYSTNVGTEYFKYGLYSPFFSLQNAVCFIMLTCHRYGPEVDWWSVGCVMFEMMLGDGSVLNYFLNHQQFPKYLLTQDAVSGIKNFMQPDPRCGLGARGDTLSIVRQPFFKTVAGN